MKRRSFAACTAFGGFALVAMLACRAHDAKPNKDLLVFAAASTADALTELGRDFQAETTSHMVFSFGGSRDLARQIQSGAPADVFVSADAEIVDGLVKSAVVRSEDERTLMSNRLVVIVPSDSAQKVVGPADLRNAKRLALGDPANVPAGTYAKKWMETVGVWDDVRGHVVPTLDVRAALAAVESGDADMGVVYRTDASTTKRARIAYEVPVEVSPAIRYVVARVASSTHPQAARWVDFLTGPTGHAVLARYGFVL